MYAIAFLTDLCHGKDPASCQYAGTVELRDHLITCFEYGQMSPFPSAVIANQKPLIKQLNVYCSCRLPCAIEHLKHSPTEETTTMSKCYICDDLYHHSRVGITMEEAVPYRTCIFGEMWFCDYKGCEDAFGEVFDSD